MGTCLVVAINSCKMVANSYLSIHLDKLAKEVKQEQVERAHEAEV